MVWVRDETVQRGMIGISSLAEIRLGRINYCLNMWTLRRVHCLKAHKSASTTILRILLAEEKNDAYVLPTRLIQSLNSCQ